MGPKVSVAWLDFCENLPFLLPKSKPHLHTKGNSQMQPIIYLFIFFKNLRQTAKTIAFQITYLDQCFRSSLGKMKE